MGLFKSQKEMVACSYCFFSAADWNNADSGGRIGSGAFYLYFILIPGAPKDHGYAESEKIISSKKVRYLYNMFNK
jgi:hypothetical protein